MVLVAGGILLAQLLPQPFRRRVSKKKEQDTRSEDEENLRVGKRNVSSTPGNNDKSGEEERSEASLTAGPSQPISFRSCEECEEQLRPCTEAVRKDTSNLSDAVDEERRKDSEGQALTQSVLQTAGAGCEHDAFNGLRTVLKGPKIIPSPRDAATETVSGAGGFGWLTLWDFENVAPPSYLSGFFIMSRLRELLAVQRGKSEVDPLVQVVIYVDITKMEGHARQFMEFQAAGASIHHIETQNRKDALDKALLVDFCLATRTRSPPFGFCLISGDQDYVTAVSKIRNLGYNTVVVSSDKCSSVLRSAAEAQYVFFTDLLGLIPNNRLQKTKKKKAPHAVVAQRHEIRVSSTEVTTEIAVLSKKSRRKLRKKRKNELQEPDASASSTGAGQGSAVGNPVGDAVGNGEAQPGQKCTGTKETQGADTKPSKTGSRNSNVSKSTGQDNTSRRGRPVPAAYSDVIPAATKGQGQNNRNVEAKIHSDWVSVCKGKNLFLTKRLVLSSLTGVVTCRGVSMLPEESSNPAVSLLLLFYLIVIVANLVSMRSFSRRLAYIICTVLLHSVLTILDTVHLLTTCGFWLKSGYRVIQDNANVQLILMIAQVSVFSSAAVYIVSRLKRSRHITESLLSVGDISRTESK